MAKAKAAKAAEVNLLDELGTFRARIDAEIEQYPDIIKHALSSIDSGLSHLESARWQTNALER